MFGRVVYESFRRQRRRKLLAGVAITLGVSVATAMIAVATDIGDKINRELRTYGANLVVTPDADTLDVEIGGVNLKPASDSAFLNEADLPNIKGMFWRHNIVGFAPLLPVNVSLDGKQVALIGTYFKKDFKYGNDAYQTGIQSVYPYWKVNGDWPKDASTEVLIGEKLAAETNRKIGDNLPVNGRELHVVGILSSGGVEDSQIVAPLAVAQQFLGRE